MEKFAVDLEKVLDEFEYNEEREENVSAPSIRSPPLPHLGTLRQVPAVRPPAASYRRPSFEPINLADADFAASPPKPSNLNFSLSAAGEQNDDDVGTYGFIDNKPQLNNRNYVITDNNKSSTLNNEVNITNQMIIASEESSTSKIWQKPHSSLANDEKPDLLEYNNKNIDFESNHLDIHNQLPDITTTSVRTLNHGMSNDEEENVSSSLDLISSTSGNNLTESEKSLETRNQCDPNERVEHVELEENRPENYSMHNDIGNVDDKSQVVSEENQPAVFGAIRTGGSDDVIQTLSCIPTNTSHLQISKELPSKTESDKNDFIHNISDVENESQSCDDKTTVKSVEKVLKDELETGGSDKCDVGRGFAEAVKPIGFNSDSDVSEGDLEEYLRELEELDESVTSNIEATKTENPIKERREEFQYATEESGVVFSDKAALTETGCVKTFPDSDVDNNIKNEHNERVDGELSHNSDSNNIAPPRSENYSKTISDMEHNQILPVKIESPAHPSEDFDTSSSSTPLISENESVSESNDIMENHLSSTVDIQSNNTSITVTGSTNKCEEINTNPFHNTNPFEAVIQEVKENKKVIESTNPFDDDEDSGYVSEKMEHKRKSTNPFEEEEDENISVENSISETPVLPKSEASAQIIPQHQSEGLVEAKASDDVNFKPKKTSSPKYVSTNIENQISADNEINSAMENLSKPSDENTTCDVPENRENSINEGISGCSSVQNEPLDKTLESRAKMIPIKNAVESPSGECVDEAGVPAEEDRPLRPNSLELPKKITVEASVPQSPPPQSPLQSPNAAGPLVRELGPEDRRLGRIPPFWVPDTDAVMCMQCQQKFTVIKRRHHCRACGQVLCYKCCGLRARLEYMNFVEARVCQPCFTILEALNASEASSPLGRQPNPNNPMEYCSTIPPLQQAAGSLHQPPPSVMVPVSVLKREGRMKSEVTKQVMFSDGIRPGGDLTELDGSGEPRMPFRRPGRLTKRVGTPPGGVMSPSMRRVLDPTTHSFIPAEGDSSLPPVVSRVQGEVTFSDLESPLSLSQPSVKFALNRNLYVVVKRVMLDCCVNRECWCFSSEGLACVGQDEIVFLLECLPQETLPPKDIFLLINYLYQEAAKGSTVSEMSFTPALSNNLLGSKDHGGFLYIRTSYQCTAQLVLPSPPYLVALLIHRWETPWARLFPIRLVLRLGAEFRYYPCPLVSVRNRPPLYTDIGHTIINILADFRKYSYTLPSVRGLVIHMEDRQTTINIPRNRYDQVVRALNNSNDSVLAFGANLSLAADSHLVCMQSTEDENTSYTTQAINIHNKPRKVTGASFVVFNGALKIPGLAGKSNIVEDGLMVQVPSETMTALRTALRDMRDYTIGCGPNAEETVVLQWTADDTNFNIGVKSCIDGRALDGVPSIRVHNGTDYSGGTRIIRWTEVFILQCEDSEHSSEPLDISRLSESIARATCLALVPLLDLLSAASFSTLAVRTTIHPDNVGYEAGSNGEKLPPLYMKSLDDELIAVVHQAALASQDNPCVLELVFRIMEQG